MDIERTMAFILEQQAKFEADIARHTEALDQQLKAIGALRELSERNNEGIRGLIEVSRLQSDHVERLDRALAVLAEAHNRLAGLHEETERRLNDFIAQVSRYLTGGNGRQSGPGNVGTE